jgi:uncharacterized RDD family membrane protein YckC
MWQRLGARIIDGILLGIVFGIIVAAFGIDTFHVTTTHTHVGGIDTTSTQYNLYGDRYFTTLGIYALIGVIYEVSMIALRGATLGKMAVGIKVVHRDAGALPGWGPSLIRWVIPAAAGFACGLGELLVYISPFFDGTGRRQGWHDKAAGTFVIRSR